MAWLIIEQEPKTTFLFQPVPYWNKNERRRWHDSSLSRNQRRRFCFNLLKAEIKMNKNMTWLIIEHEPNTTSLFQLVQSWHKNERRICHDSSLSRNQRRRFCFNLFKAEIKMKEEDGMTDHWVGTKYAVSVSTC